VPWSVAAISSRKSVPPSATSNFPFRRALAPVKAPGSWPKSSEEVSSFGIAPVFTGTKGPSRRSESAWIAWAASSLPVPLSPVSRTVTSEFAALRIRSKTESIAGLVPMSRHSLSCFLSFT